MGNRKYLEVIKDWRPLFTYDQLRKAQRIVDKGQVSDLTVYEEEVSATVQTTSHSIFFPLIQKSPTAFSEDWDADCFFCDCSVAKPRRDYSGRILPGKPCVHEAALLMMWEKVHGPWVFRETDEEWEARQEKERREEEKARRKRIREEEEKIICDVPENLFAPYEKEGTPFFNIPALLRDKKTTLFAIHSAETYLADNVITMKEEPVVDFHQTGKQTLKASFLTEDAFEKASSTLGVAAESVVLRRCSCSRQKSYYFSTDEKREADLYCGHELAALRLLWDYVRQYNPGDLTDASAEKLLSILEGNAVLEEPEESGERRDKKKVIVLIPRLIIHQDGLSLTFKIGKNGGKTYILKNLRQFQSAVDEEKALFMGKALTLNFAGETFEDGSLVWMEHIRRRIQETDLINNRIARSRYGFFSNAVSVQSEEKLKGAVMDRFYELSEGQDLDCEYKEGGKKQTIHIGELRYRLRLHAEDLKGISGQPEGIAVTGQLPVLISGQKKKYALTEKGLGVLTPAEWQAIRPFLQIADHSGRIRFHIGKTRLGEFYYRVLPGIIENPFIDFEDRTDTAVRKLLPPEPEFVFRVDREDDRCRIQAEVSYEKDRYLLSELKTEPAGDRRDQKQEERVVACIKEYFPEEDPEHQGWRSHPGDDAIFAVLDEGLGKLEKYGEILVTDRISSRPVRPMPAVTISVELDGSLLDLSVLSKEVSPEELLQIYNSYRLKKKYHKLRDGSFLNLDGESVFSSIEEVAAELDMSVEELIAEKKDIPLYRSLYLDHLLQEHEELVSSRDRTYRALIKNFHTIRDADYDVSANMEEILRPYQVYGHKWMRTVVESGFGGILADEMGLGKTLEAISVIESMKQEGSLETALVVCPASLVYNWEEEIHRFSPELSVVPVAGTAAARKKLLRELPTEQHADVYITSYDLLRSDISIYKEFHFSIMIIDEAQYIKNAKAAMTRAVKVVRADKRVALTGTPIENRLAELWSIFDYLMPGFLYDYKSFAEKFEAPITKRKDEGATAKLKSMVGPFILRRRKEEVLKDLPPKLEEVRYARLEKEQRKLYDAQVLRMKEILESGAGTGEDKIRILAELTKIRQICCDPGLLFEDYTAESAKREACIELVRNAIVGGHRMLIFSQFTSMLAMLEADLEKEKIPYFKITGATPKSKRMQNVHAFNEGDVPVFLISLKAGGTGLNLTGADMVIHYDPWWNLAAQNQATDRAHRIGQKKAVTVYRLIAKDTIEEKILQMQEAKKDLADAILSGEQQSLMSLTDEELLALL